MANTFRGMCNSLARRIRDVFAKNASKDAYEGKSRPRGGKSDAGKIQELFAQIAKRVMLITS